MKHTSVYDSIVKDRNDSLQILAYALYKMDKFEIAKNNLAKGKSNSEIEGVLKSFHDSVAGSPRLIESYHERALSKGDNLLDCVKRVIKNEANQDFIERVFQLQKQQQSPAYRVIRFFLEGLKNLTATILAMILFSGVYALTLNKSERQKLLPAVTQSVMGLINGEVPVIDSYRHHADSLQIVE